MYGYVIQQVLDCDSMFYLVLFTFDENIDNMLVRIMF